MRLLRLILSFLILSAVPASAQIPELEGRWVLSTERSLGPAPEWEELIFTITDGEQHYTMNAVDESGDESQVEWVVPYDGEDHVTGPEDRVTTSLQQLGANAEVVTNKRDGEVTGTYTRVLVDNFRTIMSVGRDPEGNVSWVRVFEKQ